MQAVSCLGEEAVLNRQENDPNKQITHHNRYRKRIGIQKTSICMTFTTSHSPISAESSFPNGIVLIHPPAVSKRYLKTKFMPYGMAVIYAYLKEHIIPVRQYDFLMQYLFDSPDDVNYHDPDRTFSEEEFFNHFNRTQLHARLSAFVEKYIERIPHDAQIYAFSIVAYHQFWASLLLASQLRLINPSAKIVFGGPFITIKPAESFVPYSGADYWIKGNGEIPLLMLMKTAHTSPNPTLMKDIPGLIYRLNGQTIENPKSEMRAEDERTPDFEGLDLSRYRYDHPLTGDQTLFLPYRISKGCPSQCSFCTGRLVDRYDVKSIDKVVSELLSLSDLYGTSNFMFADASINGSPRLLSKLCDRLREIFPSIKWYAYARVRGFDPELLRKVKQAGCFSLFWGVESAYQPTIELLGKRFKVEHMYDLLDEAISVGIKNYVHLVYNTPHESQDDITSLVKLINRYINNDLVVFLPQRFLLEPQSLMYEKPEDYGLENIEKVQGSVFEREEFIYEEINSPLQDSISDRNEEHRKLLADHLELIQYRNLQNQANDNLAGWLPAKLLLWIGKLAKKFKAIEVVHRRLVTWLQSRKSGYREQM